VPLTRLYEIEKELERIKILDEIECIGKVKLELEKIDNWHLDLEKMNELD
jgi:hypothetical protein